MTINTNDLVNIIAAQEPARRPMSLYIAAFGLAVLCAILTIQILGVRPDWPMPFSGLVKTLFLGAAAAISGYMLHRQSKPLAPPINVLPLLLSVPFLFMVYLGYEWMDFNQSQIAAQFPWANFFSCVKHTFIYGAAGIVALTFLMRQFAPANATAAAQWIGLCAAFTGGLGYSLHCPFDSPTFIVFAYGLPVLALILAARFTVPYFIKW